MKSMNTWPGGKITKHTKQTLKPWSGVVSCLQNKIPLTVFLHTNLLLTNPVNCQTDKHPGSGLPCWHWVWRAQVANQLWCSFNLAFKKNTRTFSFNLDHLYTKVNLGARVLVAKRKQTDTCCRHLDVLIYIFDITLRSDVIANQATT